MKSLKADVSSVSPSLERLEELCVGLYAENRATLFMECGDIPKIKQK